MAQTLYANMSKKKIKSKGCGVGLKRQSKHEALNSNPKTTKKERKK
jgi:hypothetical protein